MNCFIMAIKNLKKNLSYYSLYLLSVSLVITVFFAFISFSKNKVMLEKISTDGRVESMCSVISVFLVAFVAFYMSYSNRFFLRRRTGELGIYALLGYRKSAILSLLTVENTLTGIGALTAGLVFGAMMHKGIVYGITYLLDLSVNSAEIPLFDDEAILYTILFVVLLLIVMAVSNARFLLKSSLMELVRYEKSAERKMKFRKFPAVTGFVLCFAGYGLALDILRGANSIWLSFGFYSTGLLTAMLVVTGTVLFIASFLPYAVQKSTQNKKKFYTEIKIVTAPNFIYRIRSNAKTLIMLTLLSAATLTISSIMALTLFYPIAAVNRIAPSELEFRIENENQAEEIKQLIKRYAPDEAVTFTRTDIYRVTASGETLPAEYSLGTKKGGYSSEKLLRKEGFECISYSQYLSLLQAQGKKAHVREIQEHECILIKYQPNAGGNDETGRIYSMNLCGGSIPLTVKETTLHNAISFANSVGTIIVSDPFYDQLKACKSPEASILSINGEAVADDENLYSEISNRLDGSPYLQSNYHRANEIIAANSSTFLLVGFLVVLFFIAAGSILYFNNISSVSDSKADYEILGKMGYTGRKLKKIIRKQVLTFYSIPFLFGLSDCIFATIVYKTGLMQNLLGNTITLYFPTMTAIFMTAFIYFVYYCITVHTCCKSIRIDAII